MHVTHPAHPRGDADPAAADFAIPDEVLRDRVRRLIREPAPAPAWKRALDSPLFSLVATFLLTGLIGTYLAYYYNGKQAELEYKRSLYLKDLESGRSFADELNRIKLAKVAEVWERVYVYEAAVEDLMRGVEVSGGPASEGGLVLRDGGGLKADYERSKALRKEVVDVLNRDRLWLGDDSYYKLRQYADVMFDYYFAAQTGQGLREWEAKRDAARASINQIRDRMLGR
jgi:hypothetical protein